MKTRQCFFSLLVGGCFLGGCNSTSSGGDGSIKESGENLMICNYKAVKDTVTLPLSELVDDCRLVCFENSDTALFKPWTTTITDNYIGVRQRDRGVFKLFDHSGKFLCDVGSLGQGPGEYTLSVYDEIIDEKKGRIYLSFFYGKKIQVYDLNGKYIETIESPYELQKPKIAVAEDGIVSSVNMPFSDTEVIAIQFGPDGKVKEKLVPQPHMLAENFDGEIFSYQNTPAFDFMHTSVDTLFHYNSQTNSLQPVYTMTFPNSEEKPWHIYQELPDRFITYLFNEGTTVASHKKNKTSSFVKIVNDFYGDIDISSPMCFNKGWYMSNVHPMDLQEELEARLKDKNCTEENKKKLNEILSSIDENDNNYLFFGKLKQ